MKFRALLSLLCLVGILLTLYLTNLFLKSNFYENGEAYMKGFGHLLEENRVKGIFFITIRNLFVSIFLSLLFIHLISPNNLKFGYTILLIIMSTIFLATLLYTGYQIYNALNNGYSRSDRILEIAITWVSRGSGLFIGYWLARQHIKLGVNS